MTVSLVFTVLLWVIVGFASHVESFQSENIIDSCPPVGPPPFRIDDPIMDARTTKVILDYGILVPDLSWISFEILDSSCQNVIPTDLPLDVQDQSSSDAYKSLTAPLLANLIAESEDLVSLDIEINPYQLQNYGSLYTETERSGIAPSIESQGDVQFCVKLSLWNGVPGTADTLEVTFTETSVTFGAKFTVDDESYLNLIEQASSRCGSDCRKLLTSKSINHLELETIPTTSSSRSRRHLCQSTWGVTVFTCDPDIDKDNYFVISDDSMDPLNGNSAIHLCIQPNDIANQAGVLMKDVKSLYYSESVNLLTQPAVEQGLISYDGLSVKECGEKICLVETTLYKSLAGTDGTTKQVNAKGTILFQPSQVTFFNKLEVDFDLELNVLANADDSAAKKRDGLTLTTKLVLIFSLFLLSWKP